MSQEQPQSSANAARILSKIRPSYIILLSAIPFVIYLFVSVEDYQAALAFIAPGIWTTVFVTIASYILAAILGLILAGLLILELGKTTLRNFLIFGLILAAGSIFFFTRPLVTYNLIGELEGRVAIIQGTPGGLSTAIQRRKYDPASEITDERPIRATLSVEGAYELIEQGIATAAFVPSESVPAGANILWEVKFLPPSVKGPAIALLTFSVIFLLLTFGAWQTGTHPLAIFAELYVDMLRGIPMLVIILYVGFPLQGAIRDISGGFIEPSRLMRGITAISLGYAAYMAEIFRAGIQAIPKGQFEAARSLGLSGYQTARFVVLPQALRIVIPPLGNEFIAMLKDTSLLSILSLREITQRTREFSASTFEYFPSFNTVAVLYIGLTLAASSMIKWIERRTKPAA